MWHTMCLTERASVNGTVLCVCVCTWWSMQGDSGATPLFAACLAGHPDVVKLLLSRKANPNRATVCRTLLL